MNKKVRAIFSLEIRRSRRDNRERLIIQVSKEVQIIALLTGGAFDLACEVLGVDSMMHHEYSEVFTVTRQDIDEYVAKYGVPPGGYNSTGSICEGINYYYDGECWHLIEMERYIHFYDRTFTNEAEAQKELVNLLLQRTGNGMKW